MTLPETQRALLGQLPTAERPALVCTDDHEVPLLQDDRVLVRTHHVALNPYDWKGVRFKFALKEEAAVLGRDGSGVVISVGNKVRGLKPGDRVWFCSNVAFPTSAAFQEFSLHRELEIGRVPDNLSLPSASTLGTGYLTAAVTLFRCFEFSLQALSTSRRRRLSTSAQWILIWAGASSTGVYLIQLAKLLGLNVIVTASSQHQGYLHRLGADVVIDRSLSLDDQVTRIRIATEDDVLLAVDNVGPKTSSACRKILKGSRKHRESRMSPVSIAQCRRSSSSSSDAEAPPKPARLVSLAGSGKHEDEDDNDAVRQVDDIRISFSTTFYGQADFARELTATTYELLETGKLRTSRFDVVGCGFEDVEGALERLEKGEIRPGHKSVIQLLPKAPPSPPSMTSQASVEVKAGRKRALGDDLGEVEESRRLPKRRVIVC